MAKKKRSRPKKAANREQLAQELAELRQRVVDEAPAPGSVPPLHQRVAFRSLPLSLATLRGLEAAKTPFTTMTDIQNACIPHALAGRDILGAAKTGSGKTLAFVIPLLESLYRDQYTVDDGPGAIVLSPTRELAVQIFSVLKMAGKYHSFSVGLLIGGRQDFYEEQERVPTTNILIATPGRLLQHLEQTPYFDVGRVKVLVLDEADRVLDMGFRQQLLDILAYLPKERQTMLFSATQTRDVSNLATLSLRKPEYLGVHDKEKISTPEALQQSYVIVPLEHKLNAVYSFVKSHLKSKSIIFMASCAQVRHAWELFCSLRPGLPVMALHGRLAQEKRTKIYFDFLQRPSAVLFATDIAARGLDFPQVDWVVQVDAPEDRATYIHRSGRTARFRSGGKALLMLTPDEEAKGFMDMLNGKSQTLPLKKLSINPAKTAAVTQRAASAVAADVKLHQLAKKAYQSYVRSIYLMPNKEIFNVNDLPLDAFARSLGLASTPNLRFLKTVDPDRSKIREKKNVNHKLQRLKEQIKAEKLAKKLAKMGKSEEEIKQALDSQRAPHSDSEEEDDILVSKGRQEWQDDAEDLPDAQIHEVSKSRHPKKIRIEGSNIDNKRVVFNDEGEEENPSDLLHVDPRQVDVEIEKDRAHLEQATDDYLQKVRERLASSKEQDHSEYRERVRQKHKKRRLQERGERDENQGGPVAVLGGVASDDEEASDDNDSVSSSSADSSSSSSSDEESVDLKAQEEMALSLIRGKS